MPEAISHSPVLVMTGRVKGTVPTFADPWKVRLIVDLMHQSQQSDSRNVEQS